MLYSKRKSLLYNSIGNTMLRDVWDYVKKYTLLKFPVAFVRNLYITFDNSCAKKILFQVTYGTYIYSWLKLGNSIYNIL